MKQIQIILLLSLIGFTACRHHTAYPLAMQQAEQLMNTRPDSALTLLQGMADTLATLPEETRMYHQLLTIQAKDKQYITHTSDSLINRIVSFYEEYGNNDRLMMAYFYQGSTYRDMNDAPRALKAFHQAIDTGKETKNLTLLGQAYGQMGTLFTYQHLYDEALEAKQHTLDIYLLQKDNTRIPLTMRDIARIYDAKGLKDSARYYYQEGYRLASEQKNRKYMNSIISELGCMYVETGKKDTAKAILRHAVSVKPKASNALLYLGMLYKDEGQRDSALYYLERALNTNDIWHQCKAHLYLSQLVEKTQSAFHKERYRVLQDSINRLSQTETIEKYHLLYRFQRAEKENDNLLLENQRKQLQVYGLLILIVLVLAASTILFVIYVKEKKTVQIQAIRYRMLQENIYILSHKEQTQNDESKPKDFYQSIAYKKLYSQLSGAYKYTDEDWQLLKSTIEIFFPSFVERLYLLYPQLSNQELRACLLLKVNIRIKDIATMLNCVPTSITHLRTRLYKKMTGKQGQPKDLDKLIADL